MREREYMISLLLSEYMIDLDHLCLKNKALPADQALILKKYYLTLCSVYARNDLEILCDLVLMSKLNCMNHENAGEMKSDFEEDMRFRINLIAKERLKKNIDAIKSNYEYTFLLN